MKDHYLTFVFLFWKVQPHAVLGLEEWAICWVRGATLCRWSCWPNNRTDIIVSPSESSLLFPPVVLSPILFRHVSQWNFSFCPSSHPSLHLSLSLLSSLCFYFYEHALDLASPSSSLPFPAYGHHNPKITDVRLVFKWVQSQTQSAL